jgi:hypothetical protein
MPDTVDTTARPAVPAEDTGAALDATPPGDTQSIAHRPEAATQDPAVAAEQPEIPTEDASVALDALPYSNAQYPARRPEGDTQDTAAARAGWPAVPIEEATAAPDTTPSSDTQSTARRPEGDTQDAAAGRTAFARRANRRSRPGGCMVLSSPQRCRKCGATGKPVHMVLGLSGEYFCEKCCPACHPQG